MIPLYKRIKLKHAFTHHKRKILKKNLYYLQFIWHSLLGQNMFLMLPPLPSPKKETRKNMCVCVCTSSPFFVSKRDCFEITFQI